MTYKQTFSLSVIAIIYIGIRSYAEKIPIADDISIVRGVVSRFLKVAEYSAILSVETQMPRQSFAATAYNRYPSYVFHMAEGANIAVGDDGVIRKFYAPPGMLSKRSVGHEEMAQRFLEYTVPKNIQIAREIVQRGDDLVMYWFQAEIDGIPIEGQGVKMVFHGETLALLFLQNTIENVVVDRHNLKPGITRKSALQAARTVMESDIRAMGDLIAKEDIELDISDTDPVRLILVTPNSRFQGSESHILVRTDPGSWVLAYEVIVRLNCKKQTEDGDEDDDDDEDEGQMEIRAHVWVDAKTGIVIGGY